MTYTGCAPGLPGHSPFSYIEVATRMRTQSQLPGAGRRPGSATPLAEKKNMDRNNWKIIGSKAVLVSAVAAALGTVATDSNAAIPSWCKTEGMDCVREADARKAGCEEDARARAREAEASRKQERDECTDTTEECNRVYNERKNEIIRDLNSDLSGCSSQHSQDLSSCRDAVEECS
jgi:hypothetical protein